PAVLHRRPVRASCRRQSHRSPLPCSYRRQLQGDDGFSITMTGTVSLACHLANNSSTVGTGTIRALNSSAHAVLFLCSLHLIPNLESELINSAVATMHLALSSSVPTSSSASKYGAKSSPILRSNSSISVVVINSGSLVVRSSTALAIYRSSCAFLSLPI